MREVRARPRLLDDVTANTLCASYSWHYGPSGSRFVTKSVPTTETASAPVAFAWPFPLALKLHDGQGGRPFREVLARYLWGILVLEAWREHWQA